MGIVELVCDTTVGGTFFIPQALNLPLWNHLRVYMIDPDLGAPRLFLYYTSFQRRIGL